MPFFNRRKNPGKNDKSLHDWGMNLVEDGRARRKTHEAEWYESIATYCGDLWAEFDTTLQQLVEIPKEDGRIRIPVNLAQPAVRTEYAKLLKNRPMVDCIARSNNRQDLNAAKVGDSVLSNYVEFELSMPKHRRRMLQWVLICGMGGIFVDHDPQAVGDQEVLIGPDGSPVTDARMIHAIQKYYRDKKKAPKTEMIKLGELRNVGFSPFQLIYDFSVLDFTEAWWMVFSEVQDIDDIFRRWGVEVNGDKNSKPGVLDRRSIERWDITSKPIIEWSRGDTQKLAELHRLFVRPGHRYFPQGLELVFTDDELIDHTNFPWKHNMLPAGVCGHVPAPWSQHTFSIIPQIKPLVLEVSKTESQLIENRNLMANPPWVEYRENGIEGEILNKPGLRIEINYIPNVPEPHPVQMPEIPQYVKDLIPILKEHILEISGQSEVSQGKVPQGARAGVTIAYLQEEDDTKLGPTVQEYEECMERVSWLQLQVIAQEYDAPRTIRIYKRHSDPEVFDFIGTMLEGVAGVRCQAGSALPRSKAAKQQFILDLFDRQIETDPRKVREMLELSEGEPDELEKIIAQAERENRKLMNGQQVPVLEWHAHPVHRQTHHDFMISPEWDDLGPNEQAVFTEHDDEHARYERQMQQQQIVQQSLGANGASGQAPPGQPAQNGGGGANGITATPPPGMTAPDGSTPTGTASPEQ
jgi:hypothetical protein